ncbi:hypothetical protein VPH35_122173 [Triticum aestivum]
MEMKTLEGELEDLEKGVEPVSERLVHPLKHIVDWLNVDDHIKAVKDSPDLRVAVKDVQIYAVRFAFILYLTILFYNMQMLALHVSSRASRRRSRKKHSSSSSELVQGVMKPLILIRIGTN